MRSRLMTGAPIGTALALLALLGLLAPPLSHRHAPGESAVPFVEALGCDRSLAVEHLHAAAEHPRPPCPACALGPGSPAIVGPTAQTPSAEPCCPLPPGAELSLVGWVQPARAARGPPMPFAA